MNRLFARLLLLVSPSLIGALAWAQQPAPQMKEASRKEAEPARPIAPIAAGRQLFGTFPVATKSDETRKLLESAIDQYENVLLDSAVATAHKASAKDPHSALAFALWSYAAQRGTPSPEAVQRAHALAPRATPDEALLVNWMLNVQEGETLKAISGMNDLLRRYPDDKHVLYLTAEWLYFQQDYDRSREMMEKIIALDPKFPPALNMLGYAYIETGSPDPVKAVDYLKRYAAVQPNHPNPQDSLGEVLRYAGDDQGSLEHYAAALKIITNFITSQTGLGDTRTLMGNYAQARTEYDKARAMATNSRDRLHAAYQEALVHFWEGHPAEGRKALDALVEESRKEKNSYALFEVSFARAQLAADAAGELQQLRALEGSLKKPIADMSESDRNISRAQVLREEARVAAHAKLPSVAQEAVSKLELSAAATRDLIIEGAYESARGYVLFAQGDFTNAADQLAGDPHSPLSLQHLAAAQEKSGEPEAAESTRKRLKYLRAPTVEWFLVTHSSDSDSD